MELWSNNILGGLVPESSLAQAVNTLDVTDPLLEKVVVISNSLQKEIDSAKESGALENLEMQQMIYAAGQGDKETFGLIVRDRLEWVNKRYPSEESGMTSLILAICFKRYEMVEEILMKYNGDPDFSDTVVNYTPLMWAVHLGQLEMVKVLLDDQADPYLEPLGDKKNAVSITGPENTEVYEYFRSHNLLNRSNANDNFEDEIYHNDFSIREDPYSDNIQSQIVLQSVGAKAGLDYNSDNDEEDTQADEEYRLAQDPILRNMKPFDYEVLQPEEYIKFNDSDIPRLLDYLFDLRTRSSTYLHDTKTPAAIIFQLLRYALFKAKSQDLSEFLFECFIVRLKSVTNTKSGVSTMDTTSKNNANSTIGSGDIVLLSYWISVIQFLHFYFCKSGVYMSLPKFLQEMINIVKSLNAELSFSINSRLNLCLDECLLDYVNLIDVSNVLYAKNWNIFRSKKRIKENTYEEILKMLYPPSLRELMKPSPLRYIQILDALDYVLRLHDVNSLLRIEIYSQVFYYIDAVVFNRIISQSKYCSRSKAMQIRLNISALEDWLRSRNFMPSKYGEPGHLADLLGAHKSLVALNGLLEETENHENPHSYSFYYTSLYHVGKVQLQPTIELLQWLQCMTLLSNTESLVTTIDQFDKLNYPQLYKVAHKLYNYEVNERKMPKSLIGVIQKLQDEKGESRLAKTHLHYMSQSKLLSKEINIYLNPNYVFNVILPNLYELINTYGSGSGGVKEYRSKKYQPSLPIPVLDDIDEILSQNREENGDNYDYELENESGKNYLQGDPATENSDMTVPDSEKLKGDLLYGVIPQPSSVAYKDWNDESLEANPW